MGSWSQRFDADYRFVYVSRETGRETGECAVLRGGTVTRNSSTRVVESAEVEIVGEFPATPDLIRIYLVATWPDGDRKERPLGTFLPDMPSSRVRPGYRSGRLRLVGRLQELEDDKFAVPVTVPSGANAVEAAKGACEDIGLTVLAEESTYTVSDPRSYGVGAKTSDSSIGDTKLDMVNDLLSLAGFSSATTDPLGRVVMRRYVEPSDKAPSWSFVEGPGCRFENEATEELDYSGVPNHVVVRYESEESVVIGEAFDNDPESAMSTAARGRTVTQSYEYTSLPDGDSEQEMQNRADERAYELLWRSQSVVRRISGTHIYAPVGVGDCVRLDLPGAGITGKFDVRVQKIRLIGGCPVDCELRRFVRLWKS